MTTGNLRKSRGLFVHFTPDGRRKKRGCLLCKNVDWFKFHAGTKHRFPWYSREVSLQPDFTKETGTSQRRLRYTVIGKFHRWHEGTQRVQTSRHCNVKNKVNNNINTFLSFFQLGMPMC